MQHAGTASSDSQILVNRHDENGVARCYRIDQLAGVLLIWGCRERGRATKMISEQVNLLAWAASTVGLAATFGTQLLLQIVLVLLVSAGAPDALEPVWEGVADAFGIYAQRRAGLRLVPRE